MVSTRFSIRCTEVRFVNTKEQLFVDYLHALLFFTVAICLMHMKSPQMQRHFQLLDHLLRDLCLTSTSLKHISRPDSARLRTVYRLLDFYFCRFAFNVVRTGTQTVAAYATVEAVLHNYSWFQICSGITFGYLWYFALVWLCLVWAFNGLLFNFICFYFQFRLSKLCNRLQDECEHRKLTRSMFDSRSPQLSTIVVKKSKTNFVRKLIHTFNHCANEHYSANMVTKVLAGSVFMLATFYGTFFYYFLFFAVDRVPNIWIYIAFIGVSSADAFSWMVTCNVLGDLVQRQVRAILKICNCN